MGKYSESLDRLKEAGIDNAGGELSVMLAELTQIEYPEILKMRIFSKIDGSTALDGLAEDCAKALDGFISMRISGVPLQYIIGSCMFFGRRFSVADGVLIPRFDTETIVEAAVSELSDKMNVLDLCCGSGCIGITLSLETGCKVTLADISENAAALCNKNISELNAEKCKFVLHDVRHDDLADKFDVIVSNPPYIATDDIDGLSIEVRHEPRIALDGGSDGLDFYKIISSKYKSRLNSGGYLIFEIGSGQEAAVASVLEKDGYRGISTAKDAGGIIRVIKARI